MKRCDKCKVDVTGSLKRCPLCGAVLSEKDHVADDRYPVSKSVYYKYSLLFRILILISVAVCVICVAVDILIPTEYYWSLFVVGGFGCAWLSLFFLIAKRHNIHKSLFWQVLVLSGISIFWDHWMGWPGWSFTYIIPGLCILAMGTMLVLVWVLSPPIGDYIIYILMDCLLSLVHVLFLVFSLAKTPYCCVICIAMSVITFAALLLFRGREMREEMQRRLHM